MPDKSDLAGRIRELRKKAGLSQEELAKRMGFSFMTVRRWEMGKHSPRMEEIKRLAAALHVTEAELLNGPERQEFEVKILLGVKELAGMAGVEVKDNSFIYGVQDDKPQIHIAGKVMIGTPEERVAARELLLEKFEQACWMYDHRGDAATSVA